MTQATTAPRRAAVATLALALVISFIASNPSRVAADERTDEILGPPMGEACLYVFVGLLIASGTVPSETLRAFEPALVACSLVPAADQRRYCQPDHSMFDQMNANSPNDIDTGPFGLLTDEVAAIERVSGLPPAAQASPHMDKNMNCVDRRAKSTVGEFVASDDPGATRVPDMRALAPNSAISPLLAAAAGLRIGSSVTETLAPVEPSITLSEPRPIVAKSTLAAAVGGVPASLSFGDMVMALLAALASVAAAVHLTLRRRTT